MKLGDASLIEINEAFAAMPLVATEFLRSHGEGLHHACYEVSNIDEAPDARARLKTEYSVPKTGAGGARVFPLDPDSICGVETEFVELKK
jgi:hypothetical protein